MRGERMFVVLALLTSLDGAETAALSVLASDIADTFGISDGAIVFLTAASGAFIVLGAVPMGWLAGLLRRGPIVGVASIALFPAMMLVSAIAPNVFIFFWGRFGAASPSPTRGPSSSRCSPTATRSACAAGLAAALGVSQRSPAR